MAPSTESSPRLASDMQPFRFRHLLKPGLILAVVLALPGLAAAQADQAGAASGLPVPRFVSLKSDRVNVRAGPTREHDVAWIFTRSGLPVEVTAEFDNWRRIRDWEGSEGWVYHSLLSGRRTALVTPNPQDKAALIQLRAQAAANAAVVARLQPGVVGTVRRCNSGWCRFSGQGFDGWAPQERLFGVYPNETME